MPQNKTKNFLLKFKFTIFYILFLFIMCYLLTKNIAYTNNTITILIYTVSNVILVLTFFIFISKVSNFIKIPLLILIALWLGFDIGYYLIYNTSIQPSNVAAILTTNKKEVIGLLESIYIKMFLVIAFFSVFTYLSVKELKSVSLKWTFVPLIVIGCLLFFSRTSVFNKNSVFKQFSLAIGKFPLIFRDIALVRENSKEIDQINEYVKGNRIIPQGIILDKNKKTPEKIFLIIGESSLSTHYSLYDYEKDTTPLLTELSNNQSLIFFKNVISPAPITLLSLRNTLSFATPNDQESLFKYKNIVELAKNAGYETVWFSVSGTVIGWHNTETSMIAKTSNISKLLNHKDVGDWILIPMMEKAIVNNKKQLFILHVRGNHMPYDNFDTKDAKYLPGNDVVAKYDRTIHNTDRYIKRVYDMMKQQKGLSIMCYFSDHGEVIGKGHGFLSEGNVQFKVPLIMSSNNTIEMNNMKKTVEEYRSPSGYLNNSNLIYILSDFMGYSISEKVKKWGKSEGEFIFHVDGKSYRFKDIKN